MREALRLSPGCWYTIVVAMPKPFGSIACSTSNRHALLSAISLLNCYEHYFCSHTYWRFGLLELASQNWSIMVQYNAKEQAVCHLDWCSISGDLGRKPAAEAWVSCDKLQRKMAIGIARVYRTISIKMATISFARGVLGRPRSGGNWLLGLGETCLLWEMAQGCAGRDRECDRSSFGEAS